MLIGADMIDVREDTFKLKQALRQGKNSLISRARQACRHLDVCDELL